MSIQLITGPTKEPVTLAEAQAHLRTEEFEQETMISRLIKEARQYAENFTGRTLIQQTWDYRIDCFKTEIELPKAPLISVTSVKYLDINGTEQTLSSSVYGIINDRDHPACIYLDYQHSWPSTRNTREAVRIRYNAGYVNTDDSPDSGEVPEPIKQAILLMVGTNYSQTEDIIVGTSAMNIPRSVDHLLWPYRTALFT